MSRCRSVVWVAAAAGALLAAPAMSQTAAKADAAPALPRPHYVPMPPPEQRPVLVDRIPRAPAAKWDAKLNLPAAVVAVISSQEPTYVPATASMGREMPPPTGVPVAHGLRRKGAAELAVEASVRRPPETAAVFVPAREQPLPTDEQVRSMSTGKP